MGARAVHSLVCAAAALVVTGPRKARAVETALMLPRGISRLRMVGAQTAAIRDQIDMVGTARPIAGALNRNLSLQDYAALDPRVGQLEKAIRSLDPKLADELVSTNISTQFELQGRTALVAYEYGVRDWLNVGVRAPLVMRQGRARFGASTQNNAQAVRARVGALSRDLSDGLDAFAAQALDTAYFQNKLFTEKGYDVPTDFSKTELGDVEFGFKTRFHKNAYSTSSLLVGMRAPTGSLPSRTNLFDRGSGGGAWAAGVQAFNEVYPFSWLTLGSAVRLGHHFPFRMGMAVPKDEADALPSVRPEDGQWRTVTRRLGFEVTGELSATASLYGGRLLAWGAHQFVQRGAESVRGEDGLRYALLERNTYLDQRTFEIGTGYSSIPDFRAGRASVPFEIQALYNWLVAGRNTPVISFLRVDLMAYF